MLAVQAFLGVFFLFFVSYSYFMFPIFILNKNFITSYVTICEISSDMILSFVFTTNHLLKTWPHVTIMERQNYVSNPKYSIFADFLASFLNY